MLTFHSAGQAVDVLAAVGGAQDGALAAGEDARVGVVFRVMQRVNQKAPVGVQQDIGDRGDIVHGGALRLRSD